MDNNLIADASTFLAVALEQPEKDLIIQLSEGYFLGAPEIIHYEISNALIAMIRRKKINFIQAKEAYQITQRITVKLLKPHLETSLEIAYQHHIYAYDAFYLQCALQFHSPLLTLDKNMQRVAKQLSIQVLE
ncbi:MAG: type II toxin-antitoxin system VapC family toxin [Thioploca sp.]|nr:type II toxin-antitoxin system VapC family toxin [Thioploca sp.]